MRLLALAVYASIMAALVAVPYQQLSSLLPHGQ